MDKKDIDIVFFLIGDLNYQYLPYSFYIFLLLLQCLQLFPSTKVAALYFTIYHPLTSD